MTAPMFIHLIGILAIGLFPVLGLKIVEVPTGMLLNHSTAPNRPLSEYVPMTVLEPLTLIAAIFLGVLGVLLVLRVSLLPTSARRHVTWGCGYTAPNTRMQYTGSSFSQPMEVVFRDLLEFSTRGELPSDVFPKNGKYETHCVDTVERLTFKLLGDGENVATKVMGRIPEDTRFSFGLGLAALLLLAAMVFLT